MDHIEENKLVRPDAKGRICLGNITQGISSYKITVNQESGEIYLKPYIEIPFSENWIFNDLETVNSIFRGIQQSKEKQVSEKESFLIHLESEDQH